MSRRQNILIEVLPRWAMWAIPPVLVAAIVVGLALDWRSFVVNLCASLLALAAGAVLATSLVERVLQARRRRQWERVSRATLSAIRAHVMDVAIQFWVLFGGGHSELIDRLGYGRTNSIDLHTVAALDGLLDVMREEVPQETETQQAHDDVKWDLSQVRDVLIPRVMLTTDDETLTASLVALEDAEREWVNYLIGDQQSATGGTLRGAIAVLQAIRDLAEVLANRF